MLIVNPAAGRGRAQKSLLSLISLFYKNGYEVTVFPTAGAGDAARFAQQNASRFDLCVCLGGDGTLNETVTGLLRSKSGVPLGYIPGGTTNDFASGQGLSGGPLSCGNKIMKSALRPYDVGLFDARRYFTYVAAFGAFTDVSYKTPQKKKHRLGHLAYVLEGVRELPNVRPYHLKVETKNLSVEGDFLFGAVLNSLSVAGLVKLDPKLVAFDDGLFEVMLIRHPHSPIDMRRIVGHLRRGRYDGEEILFFKAGRLSITSDTPLSWTLDGEDGGQTTKVVVENLPGALTLKC